MGNKPTSRILGFDLHDGRFYMSYRAPGQSDDDGPKALFVYRPDHLGNPGPAPLEPGEQRYMIAAEGGHFIRIRCTEDDNYEIARVAMPERFKVTPPFGASGDGPQPPSTGSDIIVPEARGPANDSRVNPPATTPADGKPRLNPLDQQGLTNALQELDSLVGLDDVKHAVRQKVAYAERMRELIELGDVDEERISLHLVLTGNPGTGKTTVARIYGKVLKALGLLDKGHLVECKEDDLIAGYVGQTAIKTNGKCDEALDGVLYIDEAHNLLPDSDGTAGSYKKQALGILTKRMEDDRHRLVLVLSGYSDTPMGPGIDTLVAKTPGWPSRFKTFINHEDFKIEDLQKIFNGMIRANKLALAPGTTKAAFNLLAARKQETGTAFENGREIRNMIENAIEHMSWRTCMPDPQRKKVSDMTDREKTARKIELKTLRPEDFTDMAAAFKRPKQPHSRPIGFLADLGPFMNNKKNSAPVAALN